MGYTVHGILQAKTLEWVAFPFSRGSFQHKDWTQVSCIAEKAMATHSSVLAWRIPGMGEHGGVPSMGLHRVRHDWSDLATEAAPALQVDSLPAEPPGKPYPNLRAKEMGERFFVTCLSADHG